MKEHAELLYEALNTEFGLIVTTNEPDRLKQKLYAIRKEDPALGVLSLVTSPTAPAGEIWIVRKETPDE